MSKNEKVINKKSKNKLKYVFIGAAIIFGCMFFLLSLVPNDEIADTETINDDINTEIDETNSGTTNYNVIIVIIVIIIAVIFVTSFTKTQEDDIPSMLNEIYNQVSIINGISLDLTLGDNVSIEKRSRSTYYVHFRKEGYMVQYDKTIIGIRIQTLASAKRDAETSLFSKTVLNMSNSSEAQIEKLMDKGYSKEDIQSVISDIGSIYKEGDTNGK